MTDSDRNGLEKLLNLRYVTHFTPDDDYTQILEISSLALVGIEPTAEFAECWASIKSNHVTLVFNCQKNHFKAIQIDLTGMKPVKSYIYRNKKMTCKYTYGVAFEPLETDEKESIIKLLFHNKSIQLRFIECINYQKETHHNFDGNHNFFPLLMNKMDQSNETISENVPHIASSNCQQIKIFTMTWNLAVRKLIEDQEDSLRSKIPTDCDLYVFAVQECTNPDFFKFLSRFLPHCSMIKSKQCRLFGRGDRSFINPKYTGIGAFISKKLEKRYRVLGSKSIGIGSFEGSKGSACLILQIDCTSLVFVSSHYPVNNTQYRSLCYQYIDESLGYSLGNKKFSLCSQFHHIITMGDFNYKLENINLSTTMHFLRMGYLRVLRSHDSLTREIKELKCFDGFKEPRPGPDFFPTYKKIEQRPEKINPQDLKKTYLTVFKKPWYKKSKVVEKIPAFTDRILIHSLKSLEKDISPVLASGINHKYDCFVPDLVGSDHSAVYALFDVKIRSSNKLPKPQTLRISIHHVEIFSSRSKSDQPITATFLFPAPFEHSDDKGKAQTFTITFNDNINTKNQSFSSLTKNMQTVQNRCSKLRKLMTIARRMNKETTPYNAGKFKSREVKERAGSDTNIIEDNVEESSVHPKSTETVGTFYCNDRDEESSDLEGSCREIKSAETYRGRPKQFFNDGKSLNSAAVLEFETREETPVFHLLANFTVGDISGQCCVPLCIENFGVSDEFVVEEQLLKSGLSLKDDFGNLINVRVAFNLCK